MLWPVKAMLFTGTAREKKKTKIPHPPSAELNTDSSEMISTELFCKVKSTQVKGNISIIWRGLQIGVIIEAYFLSVISRQKLTTKCSNQQQCHYQPQLFKTIEMHYSTKVISFILDWKYSGWVSALQTSEISSISHNSHLTVMQNLKWKSNFEIRNIILPFLSPNTNALKDPEITFFKTYIFVLRKAQGICAIYTAFMSHYICSTRGYLSRQKRNAMQQVR